MQSLLRYAAGFLFIVLFSPSCAFDDEDVASCIDYGATGDAISVSVSCDDPITRPLYSWTLDGEQVLVWSVRVARADELSVPVWQIQTFSAQDEIGPVQHGFIPLGTVENAKIELDLATETEVEYRVTVTQINGPSGFSEFSILP